MSYETTPGYAAISRDWPASSRIQPAQGQATLMVFAHPQCPCTRATIGELNAILAECQGKVQVHVLFWKPRGYAKGWEKTELWRSAEALPGVVVSADEGGAEARRFKASTSGQVLLFDASGHVIFRGGITAGRGHAGENAGRDAIVSLLTTGKSNINKTSVFGCSLFTPSSQEDSP